MHSYRYTEFRSLSECFLLYNYQQLMGAITCCQNQFYRHEEFRQHCQTFSAVEYKQYFHSIQKTEITKGAELKTQNKEYIQGSWKKSQTKTGKGVIFAPQRFYYEGQIVDGVAKGQGKIIWPSKFSYKGSIADNKAEGYGELYFGQKNISLKGNWVRGLPKLNQKMELNKQGRHGSITFVDESRLKTEQLFFKDKINVVVELGNGVLYEGEVINKNNVYLIEGMGSIRFADGSYYIGKFVGGRMHGQGKYYWANTGNWFQGEYKANFRDGRGTYYFSHDDFEVGQWRGGVLLKEQSSTNRESKSHLQKEYEAVP